MARIKIKKVPNGFIVKNGKLLKKASYGGGFVTGDQKDYGLVTTYGADNGNDKKESDVRFSLASVPREFANIEAEGGETVLTDLNGNGSFGLYNITGPRHSQGGVPMYLPDQSFIFSDTPKMKMKSDELAKFGIESRKGKTPAEVSKKFPLNEFMAAAGDPNSDFITERSAELMLDKNMLSLSKLAFGQEMAKGFEDGVPTAAFPFIQSQGQDPVNFAAMVDAQIGQRNTAMMQGGGPISIDTSINDMANTARPAGTNVEVSKLSPDQRIIQTFLNDNLVSEKSNQYAALMDQLIKRRNAERQRLLSELEKEKVEGSAGMASMTEIPKMQDAGETPPFARGERPRTTSFADLPKAIQDVLGKLIDASDNPSDPNLQKQIKAIIDRVQGLAGDSGVDINLEQANDAIQEIVKIVADNAEELAKTGRIPLITDNLATIDNMLKEKGIDIQDIMDVGEKGIEDTQNKQESGLYGDVTMDNLPQFYENNKVLLQSMGYPSYESMQEKLGDEWYKNEEFVRGFQDTKNKSLADKYESDAELRAELEKRGISKEDFISSYGFRTDGEDGETDSIDGKFGEYTLNRRDFFGLPEIEEEEDPEEEEDLPPGKVPTVPDFYLQDKVKMDALSKRDRDLFLPDRMAVEQIELDPTLMDPTRAIAAINEQAAIGADAAGMFGPQTLSANTARNTGTAFKNIADTIAKYDAANVGILNKADVMQARFDQMTDAAERENYATVVDGTNLALQNYMDEKNLDREQFADLYANAVTNRANTYNLNTLIPYFDIDPRSGGMVQNVDTAGLFKPSQPADPFAKIEQLSNYAKLAKAAGLSDEVVSNIFLQSGAFGQPGPTPAQQLLPFVQNLNQGSNTGNVAQGKHGKGIKIKRPVVPFYTGVTDGRRK